MSLTEQELKLKSIEVELQTKASEIEKGEKLLSNKEESVNSKLNKIEKTKTKATGQKNNKKKYLHSHSISISI